MAFSGLVNEITHKLLALVMQRGLAGIGQAAGEPQTFNLVRLRLQQALAPVQIPVGFQCPELGAAQIAQLICGGVFEREVQDLADGGVGRTVVAPGAPRVHTFGQGLKQAIHGIFLATISWQSTVSGTACTSEPRGKDSCPG